MTPYLIGRQWVDLDHVLAIEDKCFDDDYAWGIGAIYDANVTLAFRDASFQIFIGRNAKTDNWVRRGHPEGLAPVMTHREAQAIWDRFIAAWKARDTKTQP